MWGVKLFIRKAHYQHTLVILNSKCKWELDKYLMSPGINTNRPLVLRSERHLWAWSAHSQHGHDTIKRLFCKEVSRPCWLWMYQAHRCLSERRTNGRFMLIHGLIRYFPYSHVHNFLSLHTCDVSCGLVSLFKHLGKAQALDPLTKPAQLRWYAWGFLFSFFIPHTTYTELGALHHMSSYLWSHKLLDWVIVVIFGACFHGN